MLDIFLNDPAFRLRVFREDEFIDVPQVSKQFNAAALVQRSGFDQPHVLLAVLDRDALLIRATARDFFVAGHEQVNFIVVTDL